MPPTLDEAIRIIAQLQATIAELQAENAALKQQLADLPAHPAPPESVRSTPAITASLHHATTSPAGNAPPSIITGANGPPPDTIPPIDLTRLPLTFVENHGQAAAYVRFQTHDVCGTVLSFTPDGVVVDLPLTVARGATPPQAGRSPTSPWDRLSAPRLARPDAYTDQERAPGTGTAPVSAPHTLTTTQLRIAFDGVTQPPQIAGIRPRPGGVNTIIGDDPDQWVLHAPTYQGIRYHDLYAGIDVRYDGTQEYLKGTYVVQPGADPRSPLAL